MCALVIMALSSAPRRVLGQDAQQTSAPAVTTASLTAADSGTPPLDETDERYRIGAGDVLDIRVFNRPQLSREAVRVDGRGMIRMPLIEEEIQALCLTEGELSRDIASRYLKYQRNPQVDVFVKEYQSQPVAVIGAVNAPGRFQLQRRVRLLELLAFAGGPSERGGKRIQVVHTSGIPKCEMASSAATEAPGDEDVQSLISYNLNDTLRGDDKSNPFVRPGDIITLPEADQIYVVGNVFRPSALPLKETITVSQAIAMAGGALPDTKHNKIRVLRQAPGSATKSEIIVNLDAVKKRRAEDLVLQANDIVEVPTSTGKRILRSLAGVIAPTLSQLPVRVVP